MRIRPKVSLLTEESITSILRDAYHILDKVGIDVKSRKMLDLLGGKGARIDISKSRAYIHEEMVEAAVKTVPESIQFWDQERAKDPITVGGDHVHFTHDSTAIYFQDFDSPKGPRQLVTDDLIRDTRLVEACEYISFAAPSNLSDVPNEIIDSYRFLISLLYTSKPIWAAPFSVEGQETMKRMMEVMADGVEDLSKRPSFIVPNNPSSPLSWTDIVAENFIEFSRLGIPVLVIPIPIAGATAPATLAGTVTLHVAENLAGVVLSQIVRPGVPVVWGGGPSSFDFRKATILMGSVEAVMMMSASNEVGHYLHIPTQVNTGRTDSKLIDYQAGAETCWGFLLGGLCCVNLIRGTGLLEFATTLSHEKVVMDNEIMGAVNRILTGILVSEETRAKDLLEELSDGSKDFLGSEHTLKWFKEEYHSPSDIIDRTSRREYVEKGQKEILQRAHERVRRILGEKEQRKVSREKERELIKLVKAHGKKYGVETLPIEKRLK